MTDPAPADQDTKAGIGEFLRSQRRLAKLSLRQLADVAKVSNAYLSQIERGIYKPSAKVLKALSEALHVSAETLYARAGFLEEDPEVDVSPAVENAIRMDPRLTTEQKETLLRVYRGFAGSDA
ncbi:MAG: helix-turn-helix domain-containing protein [Actinomycetota bacterium]|nr:helix-turn-helix domain-containing protein [Actinomycetota bacterium]